ncbi:Phosphoribosylglycinamide formyltransferase [compost metagenome]
MKIAGCTVHFVTEGMDEGPIVAQAAVPVTSDDTADTLAGRVLTVEHKLYPMALRLFAEGKVRMEGGRAVFANTSNTDLVHQKIVSAGL